MMNFATGIVFFFKISPPQQVPDDFGSVVPGQYAIPAVAVSE